MLIMFILRDQALQLKRFRVLDLLRFSAGTRVAVYGASVGEAVVDDGVGGGRVFAAEFGHEAVFGVDFCVCVYGG